MQLGSLRRPGLFAGLPALAWTVRRGWRHVGMRGGEKVALPAWARTRPNIPFAIKPGMLPGTYVPHHALILSCRCKRPDEAACHEKDAPQL